MEQTIDLYRGLTVETNEAKDVVREIRRHGVDFNDKMDWKGFYWKDLRSEHDNLLNKKDLNRDDTRPASEWIPDKRGGRSVYTEGVRSVCFADEMGAKYYATKHNRTAEKTVPILIRASVNINNVAIDGRDFLYTVFGRLRKEDRSMIMDQEIILQKIFGQEVSKYIDKLYEHPDPDINSICDLMVINNKVIEAYSKNKIMIGGRWGTKFRSSFFVKAPISPRRIIDVKIINSEAYNPEPDVTLRDFYLGG